MDSKNFSEESFNDSFINKTNRSSFILNQSQKSLHREAKQKIIKQKSLMLEKFNDPKLSMEFNYDEEEDYLTNSETSIHFQSFSLSESILVSPIAHEMSQLNGQELKDVSELFACDLSFM